MLRLDLQFYAFFVTVLCGALLGLLFDLLRVLRGYYRPSPLAGSAADLLFWVTAAFALSGGLFYANWAELRLYVLIGIGLGAALYMWLASPVIRHVIFLIILAGEWVVRTVIILFMRLVWAPVTAVVRLLWATLRILARWSIRLGTWVWRLGVGVGWLLTRPLIRLYRCLRLRYLLAKRRWRRFRRR